MPRCHCWGKRSHLYFRKLPMGAMGAKAMPPVAEVVAVAVAVEGAEEAAAEVALRNQDKRRTSPSNRG